MERLLKIEDKLIEVVEHEVCENHCSVDTHELGEVVDMIKDIEEAFYYCAKTKRIAHELGNKEHEIIRGHKTVLENLNIEMSKATMSTQQ